MGELVLQQYAVSLDGFNGEDESPFQAYAFQVVEPVVDEHFKGDLTRARVHVVGRVAYEAMSRHFSSLTGPVADAMNNLEKVVFSRTLERADCPESRIARGDIVEDLLALKE